MTPAEAAILGGVQGATEFLPVSSSGHLRLAQGFFEFSQTPVVVDVALHVGTLVAVFLIFRSRIGRILGGLISRTEGPWLQRPAVKQAAVVVVASIPTAIIGLSLRNTVEESVTMAMVGCLLLVNGVILLAGRRIKPGEQAGDEWQIGFKVAIVIGIVQGLAVLPGISRSGSTIVCATLLGVRARDAAEFSFILSIPAILGAAAATATDLEGTSSADLLALGLGFVTATVVGIIALRWLLDLIAKARFHHFAWYCFALGGFGLIYSLIG